MRIQKYKYKIFLLHLREYFLRVCMVSTLIHKFREIVHF